MFAVFVVVAARSLAYARLLVVCHSCDVLLRHVY